MPQKKQTTRERIIEGALMITRREGIEALNARNIAAYLGVSTQPIYDAFSGMGELTLAVTKAAYEYYLSVIEAEMKSGRYPPYKASGMAYIRFAKTEKRLFHLLFLRDRTAEPIEQGADDFDEKIIQTIMENNAFDREYAYRLHMHMWTVVHGIATMVATSFYPWEEEEISKTLSDTYLGTREYLMKEYKQNECH